MAFTDLAQQCLLWSAVWGAVAGVLGPRAYAARHAVHDVHAVLVCVGVCVWPDAAMAMTWGYFVVDLLVCLVTRDAMFTAHAVLSLAMIRNYWLGHPEVALLMLCELSTPFYHWAQRAPASAPRWVLFFLAFAAVRVVGLPLWWFGYTEAADVGGGVYVVARCLYALFLAWFAGLLPLVARKLRPGVSVLDTAYPLRGRRRDAPPLDTGGDVVVRDGESRRHGHASASARRRVSCAPRRPVLWHLVDGEHAPVVPERLRGVCRAVLQRSEDTAYLARLAVGRGGEQRVCPSAVFHLVHSGVRRPAGDPVHCRLPARAGLALVVPVRSVARTTGVRGERVGG